MTTGRRSHQAAVEAVDGVGRVGEHGVVDGHELGGWPGRRHGLACGDHHARLIGRGPGTGMASNLREGCDRRTGHAVTFRSAITFVGRSRTASSPGTPLRRPNSSARSAPM